jgi:hypothetical protein
VALDDPPEARGRRSRPEAYGGDAWSTEVVRLLEDALKTDLRAPGFPASLSGEDPA